MKRILAGLVLIAIIITISSCKKDPGQGGNSNIIGYVHLTVMNLNLVLGTQDGFDEDVYIIYGNDISYGDHIKTGPDGKFEFKYLRKGNYKVYVYSKGSDPFAVFNPDSVISKSVEITDKKQTVDAGTFEIIKYK